MAPLHILVLYNHPTLQPSHVEAAAEHEILDLANHVATTLRDGNYTVAQLAIGSDPAPLFQELQQNRPDAVFNLYEGTAQRSETEAYAAAMLEWFGVPFTGCPSATLALSRDKARAKFLLRARRLTTPPFFTVEKLPTPYRIRTWPFIVKPGREDASVGIDQASVVNNQEEFIQRVSFVLDRYGPPALVEQYIAGRECSVSVIEHPDVRPLPVSEIVFGDFDSGRWPIVTYESKWAIGSAEDLATVPRCPADIDAVLANRLQQMAMDAFELFGCRDYARIDFRIDRKNKPYVLEVNPNPGFHPDAGFARALMAAGISHRQFTLDLVRRALERGAAKA